MDHTPFELLCCDARSGEFPFFLFFVERKLAIQTPMDEAASLAAFCKPRPSSEGKRQSDRMRPGQMPADDALIDRPYTP